MCNLKFVLQNSNNKSFVISDRSGVLTCDLKQIISGTIIETKLKLPNILYIKTLDSNIILQELWLGNIKATPSMLDQICNYTSNNQTTFTTHWHSPGITAIEFFDRTFIEFHLHHGNNLKDHLSS